MEDTFLAKEYQQWRLILDHPADGAQNMAVDEAILLHHAQGKVPPTLRFYRWDPPAISIGFSQDMAREIDEKRCRDLGMDLVRRPTGGRAVLHDKELTYSVIIHGELLPGSVLQTYKFLSKGLLSGLKLLGLPAEIAAKPVKSGNPGSAACFDSPSWYEIEVRGRKIIGSAQTRRKNVLLQHGSIPMEMDIGTLLQVLNIPNEKVRQRVAATLEKKATAINPELLKSGQAPVGTSDLHQKMVEGFQQALGITFELCELTEEEQNTARMLREEKYLNPNWTHQRKECGA